MSVCAGYRPETLGGWVHALKGRRPASEEAPMWTRALIAAVTLCVAGVPATGVAGAQAPADVAVLAPVDTAQLAPGEGTSFDVGAPAGSQVMIDIAATGVTGPEGSLGPTLVNGVATAAGDPALYRWALKGTAVIAQRAGRYFWRARVYGADGVERLGPVRELDIVIPPALSLRARMPADLGQQGRGDFYLSAAGIPRGVARRRFGFLAKQAGRRWGLHRRRWTTAPAGIADGFDVVGFGIPMGGEAIGELLEASVRVFHRHRNCIQTAAADGSLARTCHLTVPSYAGRRVVERDIVLRAGLKWAPGPAYPTFAQFDLETALIHELGLLAGNRGMAPRCANSPLVPGIGPGDWWHTPADSFLGGCAAARSAGRRRPGFAVVRRSVGDVVVTVGG
jgi:hypothetical protein